MTREYLPIISALAFPLFCFFIAIDTFTMSLYQGFFGAVLFTIVMALVTSAQLMQYFTNARNNPCNAESSQQAWKTRCWMMLLCLEYVLTVLLIWFWYMQHKTIRSSSSVDVSFPYHQNMHGYVDWLVVQRFTLALLPVQAVMFGEFWTAQQVYAASMREGTKEQ